MQQTLLIVFLASLLMSPAKPARKELVTIQITVHTPYCGGAKPDEEMEKGTDKPLANAVFYLKKELNHSERKKTVGKFTTNENGEIQVKINKESTYYLLEEAKIGSFEKFKTRYNTPGKDMQYIGDEEAKEAWNRQDAVINYKEGRTKVGLRARCFTGLNPCLKYTGPIPQ